MAITKVEIFNSSDDSLIKEISNPPIVQYNGKDTIQPQLDNVASGTLSIYYKVYKDSVLDFTSGVFSYTVNQAIVLQDITFEAETLELSTANYEMQSEIVLHTLYSPVIFYKDGVTTALLKKEGTGNFWVIQNTPYGMKPPHMVRGTIENLVDYHDQPILNWQGDRLFIVQEDGHGGFPTKYHKAKELNDAMFFDSNAGNVGSSIVYPIIDQKNSKTVVVGRHSGSFLSGYNINQTNDIEGAWGTVRDLITKAGDEERRYQFGAQNKSGSTRVTVLSCARNASSGDPNWWRFNVVELEPLANDTADIYTIDGTLIQNGTVSVAQAAASALVFEAPSNTDQCYMPVFDIDNTGNFYFICKDPTEGKYVLITHKKTGTKSSAFINFPDTPTLVENEPIQWGAVKLIVPFAANNVHIFVNVNNGTRVVVRQYKTTDEGATWAFVQDIDFGVSVYNFRIIENRNDVGNDKNFLALASGYSPSVSTPTFVMAKKMAFGAIQAETNVYDTIPLITEAANNASALFGMKIESGKINNTGTTLDSIIDQATGNPINTLGSPVLDSDTTPTFVTFDGVDDAISLDPTILTPEKGILFVAVVADAVADAAVFSISNNTNLNSFINPSLNSGGRNKITNNTRYNVPEVNQVDGDTNLPSGYSTVAWLYRGKFNDVPMWVNGKMQTRNVEMATTDEEGGYILPNGNTNLELGRLVRTSIAYYGQKFKYAYIHEVTSEKQVLERIKYAANFAGTTLQNAYR